MLSLFLAANASATEKKTTPQQQKMGACATANKGKKGAEYKQAMSDCMKGDAGATAAAPAEKPMTQQQKMSACSKANKGKKGDDYKKAMSDCLSAK
jgi:hypothetical protein